MSEPIYVWRYVLKSRAKLNAVSRRREFEGALLRIGDGFACLHPWPELGDPGLGDLLEELEVNALASPLSREALKMAAMDEEWRLKGESMLDAVVDRIPESHATLPECSTEAVQRAVSNGFSVIKVKGGRDYADLAGRIDGICRCWPHLVWRIDFNGVLTKESTLCFAQCLTDHACCRIEFLEDPCPWDPKAWSEIGQITSLDLAVDWGSAHAGAAADILVIKPARLDLEYAALGSCRTVVTSNMDHPLGQCYAAWRAGRMVQAGTAVDVCGLQTHELFEPNEFSERLGPAGPRFQSPGGTGLGFDDLLEKLPWKRLK